MSAMASPGLRITTGVKRKDSNSRTFLADIFNDKALGAVDFLYRLSISVTKLGIVNSTKEVCKI